MLYNVLVAELLELAINLTKCKRNRIDSKWQTMMYKIYSVSHDALKTVCAYTKRLLF